MPVTGTTTIHYSSLQYLKFILLLQDFTLSFTYLKSILLLLTTPGFFLKIFDRFCHITFFCESTRYEKLKKKKKKKNKKKKQFFFASLHVMKSRKKNRFFFASLHVMKSRKKITTIVYRVYKPVERTLLCLSFFRLSREKTVISMCYLKIYIKVCLMHKTNHA